MVSRNPLMAVASTVRQVTEQANTTVKSLQDNITNTANQLIQSVASGAPKLPGIPGLGTRGNGGNSNGGNQAFPTPQQLLATPLQAITQAEDVILPRGAPRIVGQLTRNLPARRRQVTVDATTERPADAPATAAPPPRRTFERRGV